MNHLTPAEIWQIHNKAQHSGQKDIVQLVAQYEELVQRVQKLEAGLEAKYAVGDVVVNKHDVVLEVRGVWPFFRYQTTGRGEWEEKDITGKLEQPLAFRWDEAVRVPDGSVRTIERISLYQGRVFYEVNGHPYAVEELEKL